MGAVLIDDITHAGTSEELGAHVTHDRLVPTLTIVAHPDLDRLGAWCEIPSHRCDISRLIPLFAAPSGAGEPEPIGDVYLSRAPLLTVSWTGRSVRLLHASDRASVRVDGGTLGPMAEVGLRALHRGVLLELEPRTALMLHLSASPRPKPGPAAAWIDGVSPNIEAVRAEIERVARLDLTVLIRGETGTGKERIAQALHSLSDRSDAPYVTVNMAGMSPGLVASSLFGHVKGAFSGADADRLGHFRAADGGTLLLDEIGEASDDVQRALLRTLQESRVRPTGSDHDEPVDVRVIAATDAPLEEAIAARTFREPLYHRLAQYELTMPRLADRRVDIPILFARLLDRFATDMRISRPLCTAGNGERWIDTRQVRRLLRYDWPGNVRELENVARRALIDYARLGRIRIPRDLSGANTSMAPTEDHPDEQPLGEQFVPPNEDTRPPVPSVHPTPQQARRPLAEIDLSELLEALCAEQWRPGEAADRLGISRTSIYQLIRQHPEIPESRSLAREQIEAALASSGDDVAAAAMFLRVPLRGLKLRMTKLGIQRD